MPVEYFVIAGVSFAVMAFSAFYLSDDDKRTRGFARVGLVTGGTGLFMSTMYYGAILLAVLIIMLPLCLVAAWWNGLF